MMRLILAGIVAIVVWPAWSRERSRVPIAIGAGGLSRWQDPLRFGQDGWLRRRARHGGRQEVGEVAIAGEPNGLVLSADGQTLYVAQRKANSIAVVDTAKGTVTRQIPVGTWPVALALADNTKRLYCANRGNHTVSVVDLAVGQADQRDRRGPRPGVCGDHRGRVAGSRCELHAARPGHRS